MTDWRYHAACRDDDPELFFPIGIDARATMQLNEAKAACSGCPVMGECLSWALETGQAFGVWGGLGEAERRALKRRDAEQQLHELRA